MWRAWRSTSNLFARLARENVMVKFSRLTPGDDWKVLSIDIDVQPAARIWQDTSVPVEVQLEREELVDQAATLLLRNRSVLQSLINDGQTIDYAITDEEPEGPDVDQDTKD